MLIETDGAPVDPQAICGACIESHYFAHGTVHWLVIKLDDGRTIRREHGFGFDAFAGLEKIRRALSAGASQVA